MNKFVLALLGVSSAFSISASEKQDAINNLWNTKSGKLESTLLYVPRLIQYTVEDIVTSRTSHRIGKTATGTVALTKDTQKGGYELADSIVNIPGTVHDIASDAVGLTKNIYQAGFKRTNRIQMCSTNLISNLTSKLTPYHFFNPGNHLGVVVDDDLFESTDSMAGSRELRKQNNKGGMVCHNVGIKNEDTIDLAVERLMCIDDYFYMSYDFLKYNCGGYTKDVLNMSGMTFPQGVNWGVGSEFISISKEDAYKQKKKDAMKYCSGYVDQIKRLILKLSNGEGAMEEISYLRRESKPIGMGLYFQLLVLQENDHSLDLRFLLDRFYNEHKLFKIVLNSKGEIKLKYRSFFKNLINTIDSDQFVYGAECSQAYYIIKTAQEGKFQKMKRKSGPPGK